MIKKSFPIQKPLPDNVEDVQYEPATGTFKGQSTGKDYHGKEAIAMNEQYDRISPGGKNTLKRIERIKYQNNELKEKPLWLEKEEEHLKKLKHFGIENSQKKEPGYPKPRSRTGNPSGRDYWKETVKLNAGNKGPTILPEVSPEDLNQPSATEWWNKIYKGMSPFEKGQFNAEQRKNKLRREKEFEEDKKQKRIANHTKRQWGIADQKLADLPIIKGNINYQKIPNQDLKSKMRGWIKDADNEKKQEVNKPLSTPEKPREHFILPSQRVTPVSPEETPSLNQRLRNTKIAVGLSPELLGLQKQINRNVDYVLGADQKERLESRNEETTNKEEN
tara:strand:+ start:298 stop:1296 length:999 start_codon:yes stop_codon:yes gene_type:complete